MREAANSLIVTLCSGDRINAARPDFLAMITSMRSCKRIMAIVNQVVTIMMERTTSTRIWVEHNDPTKPHQSLKLQIAKTQVMTASGLGPYERFKTLSAAPKAIADTRAASHATFAVLERDCRLQPRIPDVP